MARTDRLSLKLQALAILMRRMPRGIRKFEWWWERLFRSIGGGGFEDDEATAARWPEGLHGPIRSRRFGYRAYANLRSHMGRRAYFSGVLAPEELEYLFPLLLRPGDQYVDMGANVGAVALMARVLIGPMGRGFAFEPNPVVFERLKRNFELNSVANIEAVPFAVADEESEARLVVPAGHAMGTGSLAFAQATEVPSFPVRTVRGKPYIERLNPAKPTIIKIDVEGYEVKALRGLGDFLDSPELAVIAEINPPLLRLAGDSPEAVFELMGPHGFRPLVFDLRRKRFGTHLTIAGVESPLDAIPEDGWRDFVFVKPASRIFGERIAHLIGMS
jgi:FkbM family methyltransferase